ncbi:WD domain, G-beta repeat [Gimesia chilikensis]|uniref:WD domain, G-beta repeat n=1 Tax=Gimesia chilikensis TaxID=2605989 RepID=A0A517W7B1_9PLAN|nr:WD40 repeat domain-containing protein [Gimesia chilikensis]QDU01145.1 WD domain, G-beta repeat [Gimesia chilikensis]
MSRRLSLPIFAASMLVISCLLICPRICHCQTSRQLPQQTILQGELNKILAVCYSKSGKELAAVDSAGVLAIWDIGQRMLIGKIQLPYQMNEHAQLEWDANGKILLCWSHDVGAFVIDRLLMKQKTIFSKSEELLQPHPYRYLSTQSLRILPDGKSLLRVQSAIFNVPDEVREVVAASSFLEVIDIEKKKVLKLDSPKYIMNIKYVKEGQFLATDWDASLYSGSVKDASQNMQVLRQTNKQRQELYDNLTMIYRGLMGLSADGKYLVVSGVSGEFKYDKSGNVKNSVTGVVDVFHLKPFRKLNTLSIAKIDYEDQRISNLFSQLNTVCISPDGAYIAAGSLSGIVQIWDRQQMQSLRVIKLKHEDTPRDIRFAPGDRPCFAFIAGDESVLYYCDLNKKQEFKLSGVETFDWSADGKQLAVARKEEGAVLLFDLNE